VFACEVFCVVFANFALFEAVVFVFEFVALLVIAFGGRSLRLLFAEVVLLPFARFAEEALAVAGRFEFAVALAATTPLPLKTPGLALAATIGCP
jgi:hypothetical protein